MFKKYFKQEDKIEESYLHCFFVERQFKTRIKIYKISDKYIEFILYSGQEIKNNGRLDKSDFKMRYVPEEFYFKNIFLDDCRVAND